MGLIQQRGKRSKIKRRKTCTCRSRKLREYRDAVMVLSWICGSCDTDVVGLAGLVKGGMDVMDLRVLRYRCRKGGMDVVDLRVSRKDTQVLCLASLKKEDTSIK